jgi:glycosyltransferase involved in cell wall biosynthesis
VIGIVDNGSTDETREWMSQLLPVYGVEWRTRSFDKDEGCAKGTNFSISMVDDCEFQLHLESDFELLSREESGVDSMWLHRAVDLLDSGDCDYLYLRRMRDESEARMHWWSQWMPKVDMERGEFLRCPTFWWSNNPTLFRVSALRRDKVLPLDESKDGPKGTAGWSQPELQTARPPNAWLHRWGVFVHEMQPGETFETGGCGHHGPFGQSGCKYGFWKVPYDAWCSYCDQNKDFRDMVAHDLRSLSPRRHFKE